MERARATERKHTDGRERIMGRRAPTKYIPSEQTERNGTDDDGGGGDGGKREPTGNKRRPRRDEIDIIIIYNEK